MLAYLVIREGSKWTDVYRLVPGQTVTIGRSATNQIVVKDERCSRNHAEIFMTGGAWTVRDLDSRNGTMIGGQRVHGDYRLAVGDVIRIAHCQLAFVDRDNLTEVFPEVSLEFDDGNPPEETVRGNVHSDSNVLDGTIESTLITHRRDETRFHQFDSEESDSDSEGSSRRLDRSQKKLYRMVFELAQQTKPSAVANLALDALFDGTKVDAGAIWLMPSNVNGKASIDKLQVVATRSDNEPNYHRASSFLVETVLRDGEAILARNIEDDSNLASRDSKGEIHSTGVICAPIRRDRKVLGLVHLYSTKDERRPDPDDLEFTLAVAENVERALSNINKQQKLREDLSQSQSEIVELRKQLQVESEIVGSSVAVQELNKEIARAAPSRATVLIRGESGVGKELVARAVHYSSPRAKSPFVCINCAALSESLLESELFGHEKGAFTGATDRKAGKFEAADGGTLMLDEIGEMSPSIQAKFLRVLEGHPFERVGGSKAIKVDVRVIAATNRDLEKAVKENSFRRDLYFRLHVIEILIPPLRKRPSDVIELATHFLERYNEETGRRIRGFSPQAFEMLRQYRWPGNIRELKNVVERAVLYARGDYIEAGDLALSSLSTASESGDLSVVGSGFELMSLAEVEREHIVKTLRATNWNKSRAASILGIERSTLDRKIKRYNIKPEPPPLT